MPDMSRDTPTNTPRHYIIVQCMKKPEPAQIIATIQQYYPQLIVIGCAQDKYIHSAYVLEIQGDITKFLNHADPLSLAYISAKDIEANWVHINRGEFTVLDRDIQLLYDSSKPKELLATTYEKLLATIYEGLVKRFSLRLHLFRYVMEKAEEDKIDEEEHLSFGF